MPATEQEESSAKTSRLQSLIAQKSKQYFKAASYITSVVKNREKNYIHAYCSVGFLFSYIIQKCCLKISVAHSNQGLPSSINNNDSSWVTIPTGQINIDNPKPNQDNPNLI